MTENVGKGLHREEMYSEKETERIGEKNTLNIQEHGNIYLNYSCISYSKEVEEDARFLNTSPRGECLENLHLPSNRSSCSSHQSEPG